MADEILSDETFQEAIKSWTMIPSSGGRFEVTVNGDLIFSKKKLGRHAEEGEVHSLITKKLNEVQSS